MHRFFISPEQFVVERPVLRGPEVGRMVKVLRLKSGDVVEILDGAGRGARAKIDRAEKEEVILVRLDEYIPGGEPPVRVTLVQGLSKGEKMDLVIQKSTELGVAEIIPLVCRRSVLRLDGDRATERQGRWRRIALEAARQCRRAVIPEVRRPKGIDEVLAGIPEGTVSFLPWEGERRGRLGDLLKGDRPGRVYIFIGPEGGFEESEVDLARRKGVFAVTLGPRILRTETAGLVCAALVMHHWGG